MKKILLTLPLLVLMSGPSMAASTTNMQVLLNIPASITVSATTLDFGSNDLAIAVSAQATVTVTASNSTSYAVALDAGNNVDVAGIRNLNNAGATTPLPYYLYQDSGESVQWGDNCTGGANTYSFGTCKTALTGTGSPQAYTVYGYIPGTTPTPPAGAYSDVVVVTVLVN